MSGTLAVAVLLAVTAAALAFTAWPLLREPSREDHVEALTPGQRERLRLREERDAALAALRELEFDHRTAKVADEDYAALVAVYRRRVVEALDALDAGGAPTPDGVDPGDAPGGSVDGRPPG